MDNKNSQFKDAADVFNECFLNTADNLQKYIGNMNSPLRLLKNAYPIDFPSMGVIPVTDNSVVSVRKRTIPTERPQPVSEVSANFS
jgi:hypothetical protein